MQLDETQLLPTERFGIYLVKWARVTSAEDVLAVRFFCQTGQHPRVVDFASFNALQREAVLTGNYSGPPSCGRFSCSAAPESGPQVS